MVVAVLVTRSYLELLIHHLSHFSSHGIQFLLDGTYRGTIQLLSGRGSEVVQVGEELWMGTRWMFTRTEKCYWFKKKKNMRKAKDTITNSTDVLRKLGKDKVQCIQITPFITKKENLKQQLQVVQLQDINNVNQHLQTENSLDVTSNTV